MPSRRRSGLRFDRRRSRASVRRRRLLVLLVLCLAGVAVWAVSGSAVDRATSTVASAPSPAPAAVLRLQAGTGTLLRVPVSRYRAGGRLDRPRLVGLIESRLPAKAVARRGRAWIAYRYDLGATIKRVVAAGADGGTVQVVRRSVASHIEAPVVQQAERNNCEAAALQILLATVGRDVDQTRLQRAFPASGPPDPTGPGATGTWGDPDLGYVGRADGGGAAGGFGIYPGPVRQTAKRLGTSLEDLTGKSPGTVYARLLAGHAVMAWVGLSDGPFGQWRSPQGRLIKVNFGEHTVVLHGLRNDGLLEVSNPLQGTAELWNQAKFESMWGMLGRRALAAR